METPLNERMQRCRGCDFCQKDNIGNLVCAHLPYRSTSCIRIPECPKDLIRNLKSAQDSLWNNKY